MDINTYSKILDLGDMSDSNEDSDTSSSGDFPDPECVSTVSYEKERMYILSTLQHLSDKIKDLEADFDACMDAK